MKLYNIHVGMLDTNCYVMKNEENNEGIIVDPGADASRILNAVQELKLVKVAAILVTHAHGDHIGALEEVRQATKAPVYISDKDAPALADPDANLIRWLGMDTKIGKPEFTVEDEEEIEVAGMKFKCLLTPGHTVGGMCFANAENNLTFVGDTIFCESIGRTDFPGGSYKQLLNSIRTKLFTLDNEMRLLPGHGPATTVAWEKKRNPFLQD